MGTRSRICQKGWAVCVTWGGPWCYEAMSKLRHSFVTAGSVRRRKFTLPGKVEGRVLGTCVLYDTCVIMLLLVTLLKSIWLNLYSVDILGSFW